MKRSDRIKLDFTRNWIFPGRERLSHWFRPSKELAKDLKDGIIWLNDEDLGLYTSADNYIEWTLLSTGTYEAHIGKLIRLSLKEGDVAIDVGGNIGLQALRMAKAVGTSGKVLAVEPLAFLRSKMARNLSLNRATNVTILPLAFSDSDSEKEFAIDSDGWNQGTFSLNNTAGGERQAVIAKRADGLQELQSLDRIDLVKIDVEGFEYHVIRGMAGLIRKHRPRIIFEYDSHYWTQSGEAIGECYDFLRSCGYQLYQIESIGCTKIDSLGQIGSGNLLCIPSDDEQ